MQQGPALGSRAIGERISGIVCSGCGSRPEPSSSGVLVCERAGSEDDIDHVLRRRFAPGTMSFPSGFETNPFIRYRTLLHSYWLAREGGLTDDDYLDVVAELDRELVETEGVERGIEVTPFGRHEALSTSFGFEAPGGIWLKCETSAVGDSYAMRFLAGQALHLLIADRLGQLDRGEGVGPALAHLGDTHSTLAAAILARALGRILEAYVPSGFAPERLAHIRSLGAGVNICPRAVGNDDVRRAAYARALEGGAMPFTLQSQENAFALDGGATLGFEMLTDLAHRGEALERVILQAGDSSLAAAVVQAFLDAGELGITIPLPRLHPVEPVGTAPLSRAYDRFARRLVRRLGKACAGDPPCPDDTAGRAQWLAERSWSPIVQDELDYAAGHRSAFMWPWTPSPATMGEGVRSEESGEWRLLLEAMIRTGGYPLGVEETAFARARDLVTEVTGISVDASGAAGVAGLLTLAESDPLAATERVGVVLSGQR